jgi:nitrous oxidase accessory protein NosD
VSILSWQAGTGGGGGFYDANVGIYELTIDGLSIVATTAMNNSAIRATFTPGTNNLKFRTASIHNVEISGSRPFGVAAYWTYGIYLTNAQNAVIDKVDITGGSATSGSPLLTTGIFWTGTTTDNTTGLFLTNAEIKFCKTGVQVSGLVEGFYMSGFEVAFCGTATAPVMDLSTSSTPQGLAFHLVNGHVDAQYDGVHMTNLRGIHVHNVDFLRSQTTNPGTLLYLLNCKEATITDCTFLSDPKGAGSTENGVFLTSTSFTTISGNNFGDMQQGPGETGSCIVAYTGSTTVRVTNNIFHNVGSATGNYIGSQFYYDADNIIVP